MAKKVMEIVVCDLCKRDRPAVDRVEVDVCMQHRGQITSGPKTTEVTPCPECGQTFRGRQGLSVHLRRAHGVASLRRAKKGG